MVNDREVAHIKHLYAHKTIKEFTDDLDYLAKNYHPISLTDLLLFIKNGTTLPRKALHLTFDDGFRELYDIVAPLLRQKGIPATIFINSAFTDNKNFCYQHQASVLTEYILKENVSVVDRKKIEALLLQNDIKSKSISSAILTIKYKQRALVGIIAGILDIDLNGYLSQNKPYLTNEQINKLINDGFTFGAHSIDHPLYAELELEEQIRQTMESINFLRKTFDLHYGVFAFPHSDIGVSKKYFQKIEQSGLIDISFGTSGIIDDCISYNFQRFSLERTLMPAEKIIALQFAKRLWRIMKCSNLIQRLDS